MTTPDQLTHAFRTPFGLPADKGTPPACGAVLTDAYDWPATPRPVCPTCQRLIDVAGRR